MSWNGSGTFIELTAPDFPASGGATIIASYYNSVIRDLVAGINASLAKNGENAATANLPMGGFKHTGAGNATTSGQYTVWGQNVEFGTVNTVTLGKGPGGSATSTMLGKNAGAAMTTGSQNTLIGYQVGYSMTEGLKNVAVGDDALYSVTTGDGNVGVGNAAGLGLATGDHNTLLGRYAGYSAMSSNSNCTVLGYYATPSTNSVSDQITLGNGSISSLRCAVTTISSLSDERDKKNITPLPSTLALIEAVQPVTFDWDTRDEFDDKGDKKPGKKDLKDVGFTAQQLKAAQVASGITVPRLVVEDNPDKLEATPGLLLPYLIRAVQELSAEIKLIKDKVR